MPYDFNLPFTGSAGTEYMGSSNTFSTNKSQITNLTLKNAPAQIALLGYVNGEFTATKYETSNKFFLQSIVENNQEKVQIQETFGDPLILFFGDRLKAYTFRGTFLDATNGLSEVDYLWADAFKLFYNNHLRGTKLIEFSKIAVLTVNNQMYVGYPTTLSISMDANNAGLAGFSMTWAIIGHYLLPTIQTGSLSAEGTKAHIESLGKLFANGSILVSTDYARLEAITQAKTAEKTAYDEFNAARIAYTRAWTDLEITGPEEAALAEALNRATQKYEEAIELRKSLESGQ